MQQYVTAVIVISITIALGFFVWVQVVNAVPTTGFTAAENTFFSTLKSNTRTAFNLLVIGLIVLGAVAVLRFLGFITF